MLHRDRGTARGGVLVLETPGHRPDHLAFVLADGTLLSGDALTERPTLVPPPEGDATAQWATLERFRELVTAGTIRRIVPGHGPILPDAGAAVAAIEREGDLAVRPFPADR